MAREAVSRTFTLYLDNDHRWVAGVCAGLGKKLGISPNWLRAAFILAVVLMNHDDVPVGLYFLLAFILRPRATEQQAVAQSGATRAFSGIAETVSAPFAPSGTAQLAGLKGRFAALDARLNHLEAAVTSSDLSLRRQFKDLGA